MFASSDVINLVLYCLQQLGVTLGVGAQTILLIAYVQAMRDGVVDSKEAQFSRALSVVLNAAIICVVVSGLGITALHLIAGQSDVVYSPAFLFKWVLVA